MASNRFLRVLNTAAPFRIPPNLTQFFFPVILQSWAEPLNSVSGTIAIFFAGQESGGTTVKVLEQAFTDQFRQAYLTFRQSRPERFGAMRDASGAGLPLKGPAT